MIKAEIKAQDLQIGNYILDDEGQIVKVECIESKYFNDYDCGGQYPIKFSDTDLNIKMCAIEQCKGIPLSESVLLKCGFVDNGSMYNLSPDCVVSHDFEWIGIHIERQGDDVSFDCPIYLHQLQNLYFALTGNPLTFKP